MYSVTQYTWAAWLLTIPTYNITSARNRREKYNRPFDKVYL